jgi:uncharacterized protein (TIGR02145 family)
MKKSFLLLTFACLMFAGLTAQNGEIANLQVSMRTDGSGLVDIHFDLNGTGASYNLQFEASFDDGANYTPIATEFLSGQLDLVPPGVGKHIIWDGKATHPETFSTQTRVRVIAIEQIIPFACGDAFVDARDGNVYATVQIGEQCWMADNLAFLPAVSPSSQGSDFNPFYYVYGYQGSNVAAAKATANYQNYGVLYNWHAATTACPDGWYLPSDAEWSALTAFLGGANTAGGKMKSTRTSPDPHPRWDNPNNNASNSSGFTGFPGGYRDNSGNFNFNGSYGFFWTNSVHSSNRSWYRYLFHNDGAIQRFEYSNQRGYSVRCLHDMTAGATPPTVTTAEITEITATSAISGGNVTDDGGAPVTARGVVWCTTPNPTLEDNEGFTEDGEGDGAFISIMTDLDSETVFYLKAFAVNHAGVSYGQELTFTTYQDGIPCPGSPTVTDVDGNVYNTTLIGDQCWITENLKTTKYRNNVPIENAVTNASWVGNTDGAYCWMDNDPNWKNIYGGLYNFYAVKNENQLCPDGWHVPSRYEWSTMINYVGGTGSPTGNKLKSCRQNNSPLGGDCDTDEHPRWDAHELHFGTDEYGLSITPAKNRNYYGNFGNVLGKRSITWTSSGWIPNESHQGWGLQRSLFFDDGNIGTTGWGQRSGLTVRCIKNSTATGEIPTVITKPVAQIDQTSAVSGGDIYFEGHAVILTRGLVWGTNPEPTIEANDGITFNDKSTGAYDSHLDNLIPDTTYYVRAYATNIYGTGYGQELVLETLWECGHALIDDRDGNGYSTVQIGDQCWMAENLAYLPEVFPSTQGSDTDPYYYVYDYQGTDVNSAKATANYQNYGVLYNWPASLTSCPEGWHLPTDAQWTQLVNYVVSQGYLNNWNDPNGTGNALKSCRQENSPLGADCNTSEHPRWHSNSTHHGFDEFGFSAIPGGFRDINGPYLYLGGNGYYWSSSEFSATRAWFRFMYYVSAGVYNNNYNSGHGFSVRCIRD